MPVEPSARVECPHAAHCGGCALIALPYAEQLTHKRAALAESLAGYPELAALPVADVVAADAITDYRLRAKLVVVNGAIGLYARGSHDVVDLPACRVLDPRVARAVAAVRARLPFPFALLALDARAVDGGTLVTLVVEEGSDEAEVKRAADDLRAAVPEIVGVSISRRAARSPVLLGSPPRALSGVETASHRISPEAPWHVAAPGSFVQAHAGQAAALHALVERELASALGGLKGQRILELYAGSGALALSLARAGAQVTAVDSYEPGIRRLEAAAREQTLEIRAVADRAEAVLAREKSVRAVIVDPPRRGLSPEVRMSIARLKPEAVVVVACSPATFARDLAHFARMGYAASGVTPLDMIPLSDAVEAFALLRGGAPPSIPVLYESTALIVVNKPPFLPTTPQGEYDDSLLARVRALPGAARAVPVHRLDIGTSGVCLFARTPEDVEPLARALARSQKQYTALVRGIVRDRGNIRRPLRDDGKSRPSLTRYKRERVAGTHSLVTAMPQEGRQHQIRRHFAGIGHPVLGDTRYGDPASNRYFEEQHGLDRAFLHLGRLELALDSGAVMLEAGMAGDLGAVVGSLTSPF
ncbi:MAG TPA: pseudouridine synthase [Burkholderiales bacterium]|nr:pseudouridine synthase [Burkholderiales bacterium]